ncbi:MAG: GntR family transcriptional regulator [Victivallaceae bacterium]|nr:GntR family transcriptional regulator [Victivallaceae bacterium]
MVFEDIKPLTFRNTGKHPKYAQLAEYMESWIINKQIPGGTKLPNNRHLAEFFKVTPVTINHSLQEMSRKGIIDLKVGSGTYVALPKKRISQVMRIGVLCHALLNQDDYYTATVMNNFHAFWRNHKADVVVLEKSNKDYRKTIEEYSLDGVMVLFPQAEFEPEIAALSVEKYPIVSIGTKFPALKGHSFGTDHAHTAAEVVKFLARTGHRNIGIIMPPGDGTVFQKRLEGYRQGMWENKLPLNPAWIIEAPEDDSPPDWNKLEKLFNSPDKITAFLFASCYLAIPFYNLMAKQGYRIPEDISLMSFDDPFFNKQLNPALTVYAQPIEQFTRKAAQSLLNQITTGNCGNFEEDIPFLIERKSVANIT